MSLGGSKRNVSKSGTLQYQKRRYWALHLLSTIIVIGLSAAQPDVLRPVSFPGETRQEAADRRRKMARSLIEGDMHCLLPGFNAATSQVLLGNDWRRISPGAIFLRKEMV